MTSGMMLGMEAWKPITPEEFRRYLERSIVQLSADELRLYEQYRLAPFHIFINRRCTTDEKVYVVARKGERLVVFEDVENQFAIGTLVAPDRVEIIGWHESLGWAIRSL